MSDARDNILARLRRARREPVTDRETAIPPTEHGLLLERFITGLEKASATHQSIPAGNQIGPAIEDYLHRVGAGPELVVPPAMMHSGELQDTQLRLLTSSRRGDERSVLTVAYAGIAETGSLVVMSGTDRPMSRHFLPENFICLLNFRDLLTNMESLWARMNNEQLAMPRALTLVTGPSRTADVEQTLQMGAHGPRRVHVILLQEAV